MDPWVRKIPWSRKWPPAPVFLPGKLHGQRSLVGYGPCSHKESDMTECTHNIKFTILIILSDNSVIISAFILCNHHHHLSPGLYLGKLKCCTQQTVAHLFVCLAFLGLFQPLLAMRYPLLISLVMGSVFLIESSTFMTQDF